MPPLRVAAVRRSACSDRVKVASFNVNSIRARLVNITEWLDTFKPDIVCLQEIKAQDDNFPFADIEAAGYHASIVGQKSYNGVAVLSREPVETRLRALPGDSEDEQARYIEVETRDGFIVGGLYLPNGNPAPGPTLIPSPQHPTERGVHVGRANGKS